MLSTIEIKKPHIFPHMVFTKSILVDNNRKNFIKIRHYHNKMLG